MIAKAVKLTKAQEAEENRIAVEWKRIHHEQMMRRGLDGRTGYDAIKERG